MKGTPEAVARYNSYPRSVRQWLEAVREGRVREVYRDPKKRKWIKRERPNVAVVRACKDQ